MFMLFMCPVKGEKEPEWENGNTACIACEYGFCGEKDGKIF